MTTTTATTIIKSVQNEPSTRTQLSTPTYPDPEFSQTTLNYYKPTPSLPPDLSNSTLSEHELRIARRGESSPNIARTPVKIRNIAGRESDYSISDHGFTVGHLDSKLQSGQFKNDEMLKRVYFPEVSVLLKRETGAREVFQYEWHVRTGTLEEALEKDSEGKVDIDGPVRRVHIDESPASAVNEYRYYMRPDAPENDRLKGRKFGIYNVWKPLKTIRKDPLCLCDARTVMDEDLQSGKVQVPNVGEIENFAIRPPAKPSAHEFVYVRGQRPDQALVFRIYDGRVDGQEGDKRSHGVPHTSFEDPGTEREAPRESVEVRSFCVF